MGYEENGVDAIAVDYGKMTPLLFEAMNELRAEKDSEIAALAEHNEALEARVAELERVVQKLAQHRR
ncbi:MAG: hypothetical protein KDA20_07340 [Phycisphaerales bacterium]|nr:hypothetical protein [Phycisphaerales bacterium]